MTFKVRKGMAVVCFGNVANPRSGGNVRTRSVIDDLATLGVKLTVFSVGEPPGSHIASPRLPINLVCVSGSPPEIRRPMKSFRSYWVFRLATEIYSRRKDFDVLLLSSAMVMPSVWLSRWRGKILLDNADVETLHYRGLPRSWSNRWRGLAWRLLESWSSRKSDVVVAVSSDDMETWKRVFPECRNRLEIVEHRHWSAPKHQTAPGNRNSNSLPTVEVNDRPRLVFLASMVGKHNRDTAEWILENLAPKLNRAATILFVGPGTERFSVRRIGVCEIIALGEVEQLSDVLHNRDIGIAPILSGGGVKTKVLDYLALGMLVVGTAVAFEGIESCPDLVVSSLGDFPARVDELIASPETQENRTRRQERQREWLTRHDQNHTIEQWKIILRRINFEIITD